MTAFAYRAALFVGAFAGLYGVTGAAGAQDFYRGKTITVAVGSTAGGGYDAYARLLARALPNHIPGKPNVVVEDMPGGGSWNAVLHLDSGAPADGTAMTIFNAGLITETITDPQHAKAKLSDYAWVGSVTRDIRTCYVWAQGPFKSWQDLKKPGKPATFGGTGVGSASYNDVVMLNKLFGLNAKVILGYPGRSEVHLAIERGELDGECGSLSGLPPTWLSEHKITYLLRLSDSAVPEVPDNVPYLGSLTKTPEEKQIFDVLTVANETGRPFIMSRRVPAERLAVMRAAFDATMTDPDFLAQAQKQSLPVIPIGGAKAQEMIKHVYDVPPPIAAKAKAMITQN